MTSFASANQGCPSSPNGLRTSLTSGKGPGTKMPATMLVVITAPHNQATGRHLLEGSLPSGNSRIRKVPSSTAVGGKTRPASPPRRVRGRAWIGHPQAVQRVGATNHTQHPRDADDQTDPAYGILGSPGGDKSAHDRKGKERQYRPQRCAYAPCTPATWRPNGQGGDMQGDGGQKQGYREGGERPGQP